MNHAKKILAVILTVCTVLVSIPFVASAAVDPYEQSLLNQGWPAEYASKLTKLHYAHPNWVFQMDDITGMNSTYTWDHVISEEYNDPAKNLIDKSYGNSYPIYRRDTTLYDSGWYPTTKATQQFFIDSSNFLDEYNIFMFENLGYSDRMTVSVVENVLAGCFMANKVIPDAGNTKTYAQYFVEVGRELNISPVHIASRLKQEQGTGTSPLISGKCGDTIGNTKYNGYYNYFNIGASGTGYQQIYTNGMVEAYNGGWNTHMKAIKGGATKLADKYINDYQHTQYYQKFNIHPKSSRNFWGQYMQNISAPYSESRRIQKAYAQGDLLDLPFVFSIPVIAGKPASNPNPGPLFRDDEGKTYVATVDAPVSGGAANAPVYLATSVNVAESESFHVRGWAVHKEGVAKYQYSIDGGAFKDLPGSFRQDVANAQPSYTNCTTLNAFEGDIPVSHLPTGRHSIAVRGVDKSKNYFLITVFDVAITAAKFESCIDSPTGLSNDAFGIVSGSVNVNMNDDATEKTTFAFNGWSLHEHGVAKYQYSLNGGTYKDLKATFRTDVASLKSDYTLCTDINAFADVIDISGCTNGANTLDIQGVTKKGMAYPVASITLNVKAHTYINEGDVPDTTSANNKYATYTDSVMLTQVTQTYAVSGWSVHSNGVTGFAYSIDGGEKIALKSSFRQDVANATSGYTCSVNAYNDGILIGNLASGAHTVAIYGKTNSGNYYKTAVITLNIDATAVEEPYENVTIEPSVGNIDSTEKVVVGIDTETTAEELLSAVSHGYITDKNGNKVTSGKLGSGYVLVGDRNGVIFERLTIIVNGDVDGDATINSKDIILAKLMNSNQIPKTYFRAADLNNDGTVTSAELDTLASYIVK